MRRGIGIDLALGAVLALMAGSPALAQPASEFRLPPGGETPRPAAGPVDPETPTATPTPAPSPTPLPRIVVPPPTPRATPTATPTARATPAPAAGTPARPATPTTRPGATATRAPATAAPATTAPPPTAPTGAVAPPPAGVPVDGTAATPGFSTLPTETTPVETAPSPAEPASPVPWSAIGGGIALLLALALIVWLLQRNRAARRAAIEDAWDESPATPAPAPAPAAPAPPAKPDPAPASAPAPAPAPAPTPAPAAPLPHPTFAAPFDVALDSRRLTLALINATLVYRLAITNRGTVPLGPLRITGDMISAHASRAVAEQLDPDPTQAWLSHDFEAIPPGETMEIDGELRLPRSEIRPIQTGNASLFVPLVRFTLQALAGAAPTPLGARIFVIGEEPDQPGGPVRPFRLNEGSRVYSRLSQREVDITPEN